MHLHTYFVHPVQFYVLPSGGIKHIFWGFFFNLKIFSLLYIDIFRVYFSLMLENLKQIKVSYSYALENNNAVIEWYFLFTEILEENN